MIDKLAAKSKNLDHNSHKELSQKEKSSNSFQLKNISFKEIKQNIRRQTSKDSNSNIKEVKEKSRNSLRYRLAEMWPSNFISQFYYLYARNIMIFQKKYVSKIFF